MSTRRPGGREGVGDEEGLGSRGEVSMSEQELAGVRKGGVLGERKDVSVRGKLIEDMKREAEERRESRRSSIGRYDMGATAKVYGLRALATVVEIMEDTRESGAVRLACAREVLDRGFGKAKQVTEVSGLEGDEIRSRLVIEFVGVPARAGNGAVSSFPQVADARSGNGTSKADIEVENEKRRAAGETEVSDWRTLPRGPRKKNREVEAVKTVGQVNSAWLDNVIGEIEEE